ncbi:DAK2 domain-containing protein [Metabacillus kandeliae]|uniref:DAK2 domain-containing protein n=1 Tax=Metabacillus kandeliae TaxID=2900151 RepID=UPI002F90F025
MGGASGPLFGTAFIKFASAWAGKSEVEQEDLQKGFKEAVEGIKMRGKAEKGQKTIIDIWEPFGDALAGKENLDKVIDEALEAAKELQASKGRASYFGEATKGLHDPGALSSAILLKQIAGVLHG